jgi:hypothetical protein
VSTKWLHSPGLSPIQVDEKIGGHIEEGQSYLGDGRKKMSSEHPHILFIQCVVLKFQPYCDTVGVLR